MVKKLTALHESWDPPRYAVREDVGDMYHSWLTDKCDDDRAVFLVADREAVGPVAFLIGTMEEEIPIYKLAEYGFIHDLWVEEEYRCEGIARQLVMLAVERFGAIGAKQIRLSTAAANAAARKLFESCGFARGAVEMMAVLE
jgi:ribosomal protein S18 acetylase RimI-like enzyme